MKALDLMIGDQVLFNEKPTQIVGIRNDMDGAYARTTTKDVGYPIETFEPILLTEKVLVKSGFKYSEWYGWQIKEPDFTLCFVGNTPHFLLDDIFVCDCPYVHTLQHALKLCGIEKEIVL